MFYISYTMLIDKGLMSLRENLQMKGQELMNSSRSSNENSQSHIFLFVGLLLMYTITKLLCKF